MRDINNFFKRCSVWEGHSDFVFGQGLSSEMNFVKCRKNFFLAPHPAVSARLSYSLVILFSSSSRPLPSPTLIEGELSGLRAMNWLDSTTHPRPLIGSASGSKT